MRTDITVANLAHRYFIEKNLYNNFQIKLSPDGLKIFEGKDVARLPAVFAFKQYCNKYNIKSEKMLTFSGEHDFECNVLEKNVWHNKKYEDDPVNNDVQDFDYIDKDYDFIMFNQTFEHILDPFGAIECVYKHLKPGGYFFSNWPVINIRHMEPLHFFTGLTVTYINYGLLKAGFNVLECGTWGNRQYVDYIFKHQTWPDYRQVGLQNELQVPCIGWVLAQK